MYHIHGVRCVVGCFLHIIDKNWTIITVRRYALHGLCDRNYVRPSVSLTVTLVDCVHIVQPPIMVSSPYGSAIILVSDDITFIPKFEDGHPERGR